jgi:hypothetical protein
MKGALRFTSITRRHCATGISQLGALPPVIPALFTRMSIRPWAASVFAVASATAISSDRSSTCAVTVPSAASAARLSSAFAGSMSQIETAAPDATMRRATASPMPRAPPVTTATRPARSSLFISLSRRRASWWP